MPRIDQNGGCSTFSHHMSCDEGMMLSPAHYFEANQICTSVVNGSRVTELIPIADDDFDLKSVAPPGEPTRLPTTIPVETIILDGALHRQLPMNTPLGLAPIYGWLEMNEISPQAFGTAFLKQISSAYQRVDSSLNVLSSSSFLSDQEFLTRLRSKQNGRILFHYVGYGFPTISADRIWLPGPVEFKIKSLFTSIRTPSFFIFDCDNAGVAIDAFAALHPETPANHINMKSYHDSFFPQTERNDYFVMCATRKGEELPKDPVFPRDLLTAILLTPVKTALYISRCTYYRTSMEDLANEPKYTTARIQELEDLLNVIIDSIVCDCLPSALLHRFFRGKGTTTFLFRNFVLAQYLLRPLGIHPTSKPDLPDMSQHRLWEYWKAVIDNTIGSVGRSTLTLTEEYYRRAVATFSCFLEGKDYRKISPSLLETMIQVGNYTGVSSLLIAYPAARDSLCNVVVFENMFRKLLTVKPDDPSFKCLCHLIICMLSSKTNRVYEIPSDFTWKDLLALVLDTSIPALTRSLIAAIMTCAAGYNKSLRALIATTETFKSIQQALCTAAPCLFVWLLMIVKRAFDVFSADPVVFAPTGFHIQCCVCSFHHSPECRAASVTVLPCFFQGNQSNINIRMLMYALHTFTDMSYLVRYQLVLLIIRHLRVHHDEIMPVEPRDISKCKSFAQLTEHLFRVAPDGDIREFFCDIDAELDAMPNNSRIYQLLHVLGKYFTHDPHPVIAKDAALIDELFVEGIDEDSFFLPGDGSSDSEAFFNIAMHQTLRKNLEDTPPAPRETVYELQSDNDGVKAPLKLLKTIPLSVTPSHISFDPLTCGIAAAQGNSIYYFKGSRTTSVVLPNAQITDLKVTCWFDTPCAIAGKSDGTCALWKVGNSKPSVVWRADPCTAKSQMPVLLAVASDRPRLATVRGPNYTVLWDAASLRMVSEFPNFDHTKATAIALHPSDSNLLCTGFDDGSITVRDTRTSEVISTFQNAKSPVIKVVGNARNNSTIYSAHQSGATFRWKAATIDAIPLMMKYELRDFDAHPTLPILLFAPKAAQRATFASDDGKLVHVVKGIPAGSIAVLHPTQNIFAFGTPDQEIRIYQSNVM